MGNLMCSVSNCAFNQNKECTSGSIDIRGTGAVNSQGTRCSSYANRGLNNFTNSVGFSHTNTENIKCEACNCSYNFNKKCIAENVTIAENKATCNTFQCK